jgi:hypothetical protein
MSSCAMVRTTKCIFVHHSGLLMTLRTVLLSTQVKTLRPKVKKLCLACNVSLFDVVCVDEHSNWECKVPINNLKSVRFYHYG